MLSVFIIFIGLLVTGLYLQELRWSHVALCFLIALGAVVPFAVFHWHSIIYTAVLGVIDVVLVLVVFKDNIQI